MQALHPIQSGRIMLGDMDLKYIDVNSVRTVIAVVPQEIPLFAGSILDNIAVGQNKVDLERVVLISKELGDFRFY
jgi:ATP-binding cassette subfamily B protein